MSNLYQLAHRRWLGIACIAVGLVGCAGGKPAPRVASTATGATNTPSIRTVSHRIAEAGHDDMAEVANDAVEQLAAAGESDFASLPTAAVEIGVRPRDANAEPDSFRDLSETEMLTLAIQNSAVLRPLGLRILENPEAATTIYDTAISDSDPFFGPDAALAEFDSVLSASVNAQNNDRVFNNATLGGDVQELVQDLLSLESGWQRRSTNGAIWELNSITGYDSNNRQGNRFPSYWERQLEAGVRQPLLQGAGRQFNLIAGPNARPGFNFSNGIIIARINTQISDADFKIRLRNFIRDLYSAYWDLDRQYRNYQSVLAAQNLAYETWQATLAKNKANLAGGEADKEAQSRAKYYRFRREVQVTLGGQAGQGGLYNAERRLRNLIGLPIVDGQLIRPVDNPPDAEFLFDYDKLVSQSMCSRTELIRQSLRVRQEQLRLVAAKNFLLPQMDLVGRYRLRGLGDDLYGDGPGRFSSAYEDFFSFDHQEWEFGLEMGVVAGRRQAHAAVRNARLKLTREQTVMAEQQRSVRLEVSDAFAEVASSYASMETSRAQADATRQRLEASQALFDADKIQIEFLLDAQEELLRAELQLATDQARYSVSLVSVGAAAGSLLTDIGIHVHQTSCQSQLWSASE